ncbi:MAG: GNAT family N-acetyltransferase [Candidatus Hodarchaeales archaeon]|jgi:RimJ/RimL family protein N-acetyltransferase
MLEGSNLILRGLELNDVEELMKHWNNAEHRKYILNKVPQSREEEIEWIKHGWQIRSEGKGYIFAIIHKESHLYIGHLGLDIKDRISGRGSLGIAIFNKEYWNKGYGTESMRLIVDYAFKTLNLHSVELELYADHPQAQRCYEKVGFKVVGRHREAYYNEGKYVDSVIMDLLKTEW